MEFVSHPFPRTVLRNQVSCPSTRKRKQDLNITNVFRSKVARLEAKHMTSEINITN